MTGSGWLAVSGGFIGWGAGGEGREARVKAKLEAEERIR